LTKSIPRGKPAEIGPGGQAVPQECPPWGEEILKEDRYGWPREGFTAMEIYEVCGPPEGTIRVEIPGCFAGQTGICPGCGSPVSSSRKDIFCPHCGSPMTLG
jgi:hypothetical protein